MDVTINNELMEIARYNAIYIFLTIFIICLIFIWGAVLFQGTTWVSGLLITLGIGLFLYVMSLFYRIQVYEFLLSQQNISRVDSIDQNLINNNDIPINQNIINNNYSLLKAEDLHINKREIRSSCTSSSSSSSDDSTNTDDISEGDLPKTSLTRTDNESSLEKNSPLNSKFNSLSNSGFHSTNTLETSSQVQEFFSQSDGVIRQKARPRPKRDGKFIS